MRQSNVLQVFSAATVVAAGTGLIAGSPTDVAVFPDAPRGSFVEFDNGDRLPGSVVRHVPETFRWSTIALAATPMNHPESLPATLEVRAGGVFQDQPAGGDRLVQDRVPDTRVRRDRVRRIAWDGPARPAYEPKAAFLRDGRSIRFRNLRWMDDAVMLLLDDGQTEKVTFTTLAELHLATRLEPWDAWVESLVDNDATAILRLETTAGLRASAPSSRFRPTQGTAPGSGMIQPSWSLDPLFVPPAHQCRMLRLDPAAPPLSILSPGRVSQRSAFGGSWQWQADHNVRGGPLETAAGTARWGFGVQARTELAFPLCGFTSGFRARVGLDAVVGRGGCARALIHADGVDSPPLWKSDLLIGSGTVADSGLVRLAAGDAAPREIVLVADDAHADRPPGADPFDIRDAVDWVDPVIVLDTGALRNRHAVRLPAVISAWNGWSIDLAAGATVEVTSVLDPLPASGRAGWIATAAVTAGEMRLRRRFPAPRPTEHLVIAASSMGDQPAEVQLRADGRRWNLPIARHVAAAPAVPLVLPLTDRPAGPLDVELAVPPGGRLWWHALGVVGPIDVDWHVLPPEAVESSAGSKLTVRDDGSVLVSGPVPKADRYALRFKCPISDLRALRIDLLPEQGCSSRDGSSGVIQTTGFSATIDVDGVPHNLVVETAAADPATGNPMLAIAGQAGQAWLIHGHQPASAMFQLAARNPPVRAGDTVTLTLEFSRGEFAARCFRILGSADADARLPVRLATYLVHEPRPATAKDGRRTLVALPPAPDRQE